MTSIKKAFVFTFIIFLSYVIVSLIFGAITGHIKIFDLSSVLFLGLFIGYASGWQDNDKERDEKGDS